MVCAELYRAPLNPIISLYPKSRVAVLDTGKNHNEADKRPSDRQKPLQSFLLVRYFPYTVYLMDDTIDLEV